MNDRRQRPELRLSKIKLKLNITMSLDFSWRWPSSSAFCSGRRNILGLVCRPETVVTPQFLRDGALSPGFNLFAAFGAEESAATHWPYRWQVLVMAKYFSANSL